MTSPGAVFKNVLIIASRVNESYDASPGHIRGYDTVTGALKWIFHTIPARRTGRPRLLEVGQGGELRRRQRLGRRDHRRTARLGVRRHRLGDRGLLRRLPQGRQPVRQLCARARCDDGRAQVALPDRAPRHLGLRQSAGADPGHDRIGTDREGRRRAAHEDGLHVRARSRHRQAALSGAGSAGAALDRARRGNGADAADSAQAAAARSADPDGSRSDQHHAGSAGAGAAGTSAATSPGRSIRRRACRARSPRRAISAAPNGTAPASIRC